MSPPPVNRSMSEPYIPILTDVEDLEGSLKDPRLRSLRAAGYRAIGTLPVEEHGRPKLAIILEPPVPERHPLLTVIDPLATLPTLEERRDQPAPAPTVTPWSRLLPVAAVAALLVLIGILAGMLLGG